MQEQSAPTPEAQGQIPEAPRKPRRRLKLRTRKILAVLRQLRAGSSMTKACEIAGMDRSHFWSIRKKNPRISDLADSIIMSRIGMVEDALFQACIQDRNMTAIIFFLTNRAGEKWADRRALVNNTNVFNAKNEAAKNGATAEQSVESILEEIDRFKRDLIPPVDTK